MPARLKQLSLVYLPALVMLWGLYYLGAKQAGVIPFLTYDPAATFNTSPLLGALSTLGLLLWSATASICFFSSLLHKGAKRNFLQGAAWLTILLLADDMLQFHEWIFWQYDWLFYSVYAGTFLLLTAVYRQLIWRTDFVVLLSAGALFLCSIVIDALRLPGDLWILAEDGAKLLGQCSWLYYFSGVAGSGLEEEALPRPPEPVE